MERITEVDEPTNRQTDAELRAYRIERYEELRFTPKEAAQLADAKDHLGYALDWHRVKTVIDQGCGHKMAVAIFS